MQASAAYSISFYFPGLMHYRPALIRLFPGGKVEEMHSSSGGENDPGRERPRELETGAVNKLKFKTACFYCGWPRHIVAACWSSNLFARWRRSLQSRTAALRGSMAPESKTGGQGGFYFNRLD